jgi:hypothetical protein
VASRARLIAPFALAALSVAAGLSLGRVFDSGRYVLPVVAAALIPHALGALARRRGWSTSVWLGVVAVALVAFVVWALLGFTTSYGFPRGDTFRVLDDRARDGWHTLRTVAAPAPVTGGTTLLAVLATWAVATTADWLAFRRHTTLAAVSPALVLFVWSSTLGTSEHEAITVVGFGAATGAFLVAQNVAVLGRRRTWLVASQPSGATRLHWVAPAVLLGVIALVVGIVLAPALPGAESDPVLDFSNRGPRSGSGGGSYNTSVPPLLDVGAKLNQPTNEELFTVRAAQPEYWRVAALDDFTTASGGQWTLDAEGPGEVSSDIPDAGPVGSLEQRYVIGNLGERWLPAAYRPVATDTPAFEVLASGTLVSEDDAGVRGHSYAVWSSLPPSSVTAAEQAATAKPVPTRVRPYLALPDNLPPAIATEAARVVEEAHAVTPYAQAEALRNYFWTDYTYDLTVTDGDGTDAISNFLRDRRGFCVQFASAYAVMARTLGIPSRVAVGFTSGERAGDVFTVRAHDAHAWPEIYLSGLGWTHLFDPTPPSSSNLGAAGGSSLPGDPPREAVSGSGAPVATVPTTTTPPGGSAPGGTSAGGNTAPATTRAPVTPTVSTERAGSSTSTAVIVLAAFVAIAALFGGYVLVVVAAKSRRRARRRAAPPAAAVQGAWEEALDRLHDAQVDRDPALTPLELARSAPRLGVTAATRPLRAIARSYTAVRYGHSDATPADAEAAWAAVDALDRALEDGVSRRERWRRRLDPSSLRAGSRN